MTCAVVIRLPASRKLVPSTLTNDQVLGHAEVDFTTEDSEDMVRAKVVQAVEQLAHDIKPDYFEFVKVQFKKVSVLFVGTGHKWDFKHVKNLSRQANIPKIKISLSCKFRGKMAGKFYLVPIALFSSLSRRSLGTTRLRGPMKRALGTRTVPISSPEHSSVLYARWFGRGLLAQILFAKDGCPAMQALAGTVCQQSGTNVSIRSV